MPPQKRRFISVRGTVFARLQTHCDVRGLALSTFIEETINDHLDALGAPAKPVVPPQPTSPLVRGNYVSPQLKL